VHEETLESVEEPAIKGDASFRKFGTSLRMGILAKDLRDGTDFWLDILLQKFALQKSDRLTLRDAYLGL
jgi:hypothetical protein